MDVGENFGWVGGLSKAFSRILYAIYEIFTSPKKLPF